MVECGGSYARCDIEHRSVCLNNACYSMLSTIVASPRDTRLTPVMSRDEYRKTMRRLEDRSRNAKARRNRKR